MGYGFVDLKLTSGMAAVKAISDEGNRNLVGGKSGNQTGYGQKPPFRLMMQPIESPQVLWLILGHSAN